MRLIESLFISTPQRLFCHMLIATSRIQLSLEGVFSLKEKRGIVKSITRRLTNQFNISVAEVDHHDVWQSAVIGVAAVGNDTRFLQSVLDSVIVWLERNRPDVVIVDYQNEFR